MFASNLKTRVREKQLTLGPLMTFDFWPGYLEIFKAEGMDYAVVDAEHGSVSLTMLEELCRTARLLDFPLLIRPEGSLYHLLRKYVDMAGRVHVAMDRDPATGGHAARRFISAARG